MMRDGKAGGKSKGFGGKGFGKDSYKGGKEWGKDRTWSKGGKDRIKSWYEEDSDDGGKVLDSQ